MSKAIHDIILGCVVIACAAVSAYTVHRVLVGSMTKEVLPNNSRTQISKSGLSPTISIYFPKDANGVYILPTVDPTNPLQLGANTVGGATACERLVNLTKCIQKKNSPLASRIKLPEASDGALLETKCGSTLNEIADLRPKTVEIGCIW